MGDRIKHSGPETKFCVLCLSGEHERVDDARPAATECQTPDYSDGPCHCPFHDPAAHRDEPATAPPLPSAIRLHTQWCWDPLYPHLRRRVRIVDTRWDGETWWIKTEALSDSGGWQSGTQRLHTLDNFIESTVAVDHV